MVKVIHPNDNLFLKRRKQRYNALPEDIQVKLDALDEEQNPNEYQLKLIKRKRVHPKKGDIFLVSPRDNLYFYGLVMKDSINNINGEDLLIVMIFKDKATFVDGATVTPGFTPDFKNLLIRPCTVGREYWTRGYFFNVGHTDESFEQIDYGFYDIVLGFYCNEYRQEITAPQDPNLVGLFSVSTITGIGRKINEELIIDSSLAELP